METPAVYYFDVLPLRPQPEPLESFTSYLTRLAEANHIQTIHKLSVLCFPNRHSTMAWKDHLPTSFGALPSVATCPLPTLQATTFLHVARKFDRSPHASVFHRFLGGSVAAGLRYCPGCLTDHPHYSLTWRFLALPGCVQHNCRLLDRCGHCGQAIPLCASPLKAGVCPSCGRELMTCRTEPLGDMESQIAQSRFQDLAFLLSPQPCETAEDGTWDIGQRLAYWRQIRHWKPRDVARQMANTSVTMVREMEERRRHNVGLTFQDYLRYADCLGLALREVFNTPAPPEGILPSEPADLERGSKRIIYAREGELVAKVQKAIQSLEERGSRVTQGAIGKEVGLFPINLMRYPRVQAILERVTRTNPERARQFQLREGELLSRIPEAAKSLEELGRPVFKAAISKILGRSPSYLERYPRVRALMAQITEEYARKCEDALVDKTLKAVEQLRCLHRRISAQAVGTAIGMPRIILKKHPRLLVIVQQAAAEQRCAETPRLQMERQLREEKWISEVQRAIQSLKVRRQRVTQMAISEIVGMSTGGLEQYPRVKALLKQVVAERRRKGQTSNLTG